MAIVAGSQVAALMRSAPSIEQPIDFSSRLFVDPQHLDLGEVWEDEYHRYTLPVENRTAQPLKVTRVGVGCAGLISSTSEFILQPGETRSVSLTLNLRVDHWGQADSRRFESPLGMTVGGTTAGAKFARQTWQLRGSIKPVFKTQGVWRFGQHSELTQPIGPRVFRVHSAISLSRLDADVSGITGQPNVLAVVHPVNDTPNAFDVEVRPATRHTIGTVTRTISLRGISSAGQVLPTKAIVTEIDVCPDLISEPNEVLFGGIPVGDHRETTVSFNSLSGRPFTVAGVESAGEGLVVSRGTGGNEYIVTQTATRSGSLNSVVTFSCLCDGRQTTISVPASALGVERSK